MVYQWIVFGLFATAAVADSNTVLTRYLDFGDGGQAKLLTTDGKGNLFAAGQVTEPSGLRQIRVIKTDSGGTPVASFDFGGSGGDTAAAIATDSQGNLIVAGSTPSSDFPLVTPLTLQPRLPAGFVVKIDAQLQHILFSTLLGGGLGQYASATAVALDAADNLYVSGATDETDFPVTPNAFQSSVPAGLIGNSAYTFVLEISPQRQIVFSTYYSGATPFCPPNTRCSPGYGNTVPASMVVDSAANVIIAGSTNQTDLPTTEAAYARQCNCAQSGFIAKFAGGSSKLMWATLLPPNQGAASTLSLAGIALEPDGSVIAAGNVAGGLSTTPGVLQPAPANASQPSGFVSRVDASGSRLVFSSYLGGSAADSNGVQGVAADAQGLIWITGNSASPAFAGVASLGPAYTVSVSADGAHLASAFTAPNGAAGEAIAVAPGIGTFSLGPSGSLLIGGSASAPSLLGVANSAATKVSGTVAPLELVSLYGVGIGPPAPVGAQVSATGPGGQSAVSNSLGGVQVLFDGIAAPLLYAGPGQINVVTPLELGGREVTTVQIVTPGGTIAGPSLRVRPSQPGVFGATAGVYFAAALNQDGTVNSAGNPAATGSIVTIWATGAGLFSPAFADGTIVNAGGPALDSAAELELPLPVAVLNSIEPGASKPVLASVQVLYAGAAPDAVQGVIQINFALSNSGTPEFQLQVGSALSDPFYIYQPGFSAVP